MDDEAVAAVIVVDVVVVNVVNVVVNVVLLLFCCCCYCCMSTLAVFSPFFLAVFRSFLLFEVLRQCLRRVLFFQFLLAYLAFVTEAYLFVAYYVRKGTDRRMVLTSRWKLI